MPSDHERSLAQPPERRRLKELFHGALTLASEERAVFLTNACGQDAALRAELERLLSAHNQAGSFLEDPRAASAPLVTTGAVLNGRYRIGTELGRGGMGVVFRATDMELGRDVAVKILSEAGSATKGRQRLVREARSAAALNHPRIVAVHDVGEHQGSPFIVMELVSGSSLARLPAPSLDDIVEIGSQICDALEHAHAHGLVHRDLKPENVLMAGTGSSISIKLADLGLAVAVRGSRLTDTGIIVGTPSYMAPEQAMGEPVDGRADLYSLGVILYELTTGRVPFSGDQPLAIISQHVNAPVVPPRAIRPDLPVAIQTVILRLLEKTPSLRYNTPGDVRKALRQALAIGVDTRDEEGSSAIAVLDALSRGCLVARSAEFAEARGFWQRARSGRSHGVLFSGEPGVGKTRLGRELIVQAALEGGVVLTGACYEYEAATPYMPFAEAFRSWVRGEQDTGAIKRICADSGALLARLAPELETRIGPFAERPALPPHEERLLFFDAVAQVFRRLSEQRGLLCYVDDLHWADKGTLWLLGYLLRQLRADKVLFVASYREAELDRTHELSKVIVDWNRDRLITRIVLRRLDAAESSDQLKALLGEPVPAEVAAAIHRETEGNPFFVEEVLKALIEQGSVRRERGRWTCSAVGELQLPQSIKAAIGRRLDRVSAGTNDVLRTAAVLGKVFDFRELAAALHDRSEDGLLDALDEAVTAQLLVSRNEDAFVFTHDKIREVLYEELNPIRRRRIHLKVAEGLERCRPHAAVPVEKLAHHFNAAGDHERGLVYEKEAAAQAERLFAYDEALAAYQRALDCAETLGRSDEQASLEEQIGNVYLTSGNMIPAVGHFERALALVTDPSHRARLHCLAASSLVSQGDARGLEYVQKALTVLDPATHPLETANALATEGRFHHLAGRHRKAITHLERAAKLVLEKPVELNLSGSAASILTQIHAYLAGAYQHLALFEDSCRWARRAIQFGSDHGVPAAEALGYEFLGENAVWTGDWEKGLEYAARERQIASRIHSRERLAWTYLVVAGCSKHVGNTARADQEYRDGLALATATGERRLATLLAGEWSALLADLGRIDEAQALGVQATAWAEATGLLYMKTATHAALAYVDFRRGEIESALDHCRHVLDLTPTREPKISRLVVGPIHVEALAASARTDEARAQLREYESLVRECPSPRFARDAGRLREMLDGPSVTRQF